MSKGDWSRKLKLKAKGLCIYCSRHPLEGKWACADCLKKLREWKRKKLGCKPWKDGGPGRPKDATREP